MLTMTQWRASGRRFGKAGMVGLASLFLFASCQKGEPPTGEVRKETPMAVSTLVPTPSGKTRDISVAGVVRGIHEADLTARVGGQVERINVHLGQRVAAGQLLLTLSGQTFESRLTQARASLSYAKTNFDRINRLYHNGSASKSEWDRAKQGLDVARAEEKGASAQLSWTRIVAPFPGRIANKAVRKGDVVLPGAPLLSVIDASRLQVLSHVPDSLVGQLRINLPVRFEVDGQTMSGRIRDLSPSSDPMTHTVTVKVLLDPVGKEGKGAPAGGSLPMVAHVVGMYGKLYIPVSGTPGLFVPDTAVIDHEGLKEVYVVVKGRAELRYVRTGRKGDGTVEILSGLGSGETIVAAPPEGLRDGMRVVEKRP